MSEERRLYYPNSIHHGAPMSRMKRETILSLENGRLIDFIEFLFEHSEHCDHISQSEAWKEFEIYERKTSFLADKIREKRRKNR